jgi:glycosyltransferase involved in cell wall biosynthesis
LKVLFVNSFDDAADGGGAEVTLWTLILALNKAGHQCALLSTSEEAGLHSFERDGVRIWRAGIKNVYWHGKRQQRAGGKRRLWHLADAFNPAMQELFEQVVALEQPDVLSLHNLAGWSSSVLSSIRKKKLLAIQVLHDLYSLCPRSSMYKHGRNCPAPCVDCRLLRVPHARLAGAVSAVVGVSRFILEKHLAEGRFGDVPIKRIILNARSPDIVGPAATKGRSGFRVGFIGRLDPAKGVEVLIDAFAASRLVDATLLIAGSGEPGYVASLQERARNSTVTFLGRVAPKDFYSSVDVVVVPSQWNEPLGMVVVEAMAHGKAVIGSRRGGIPELISDGINGLLFDAENIAELSSHLLLLSEDGALLSALGASALATSEPFLDVQAWASSYASLYGEVLAENDRVVTSQAEGGE